MSPLLVYRWEKDGYGPWSVQGFPGFKLSANAMPTPWNDEDLKAQDRYISNHRHAVTEAQHDIYFPSTDRVLLDENEFDLVLYLIPPGTLKLGVTQVIFNPDHAIPVDHF